MMVENQPERRIGNGHRLTLPIMTRRQIKSTSEQPVHSVQPLSLSAPSGSGRLPALLQRVPDDDQQSVFEPSPPGTRRKDSTTGRQLRLSMLPGVSSSSADPLKADRQAGPRRHPHGVLTVPGSYPVRGVNSAVKGHRDGSQLCSGTGGKHDRREHTRGDRQHSMAAANRAFPESTVAAKPGLRDDPVNRRVSLLSCRFGTFLCGQADARWLRSSPSRLFA
jgi:hypothetical protein